MHSESRGGAKVVWLAVHTTEGIMRATALRDWTTWSGSSHASSDETGALLTPADGFVPYDQAAWTLRNGNHISENIEQCGWAHWTRDEWLSRPQLLEATAAWLAERSAVRGIPLVRLSAADIRAHKPGVLGHGDYSVATGDGDHSDPGPNYPWDDVLSRAQRIAAGGPASTNPGGFLMALNDQQQAEVYNWLHDIAGTVGSMNAYLNFGGDGDKVTRDTYNSATQARNAAVQLTAMAGQQASAAMTPDQLADAIAKAIPDDLADAVAKKLGEKLAS